MILQIHNSKRQKNKWKDKTHQSHYDIFFKYIYLHLYKSRLLINANNKFKILISKLLLAWSYRINEKAYANRRRILRRNTSSSY
jgi:hypothetical protein